VALSHFRDVGSVNEILRRLLVLLAVDRTLGIPADVEDIVPTDATGDTRQENSGQHSVPPDHPEQAVETTPGGCVESHRDAIHSLEPRLRAYMCRVGWRGEECEIVLADVIDDTFGELGLGATPDAVWVKALRSLGHHATQRRKVRQHEVRITSDAIYQSNLTESHAQYRQALWEWAELALVHLTVSQRAALESHVMDGQRDHEIAKALGCSRASVRVLRHTAKRRLRELIAKGAVPAPPSDLRW
jgi:hypothetical protein